MSSSKRATMAYGRRAASLIVLSCLLTGCEGDDGSQGPQGPPGPPGDDDTVETELDPDEDPPGINVQVLEVAGGTGPNGNFQVGDTIQLHYTVEMDDGTTWPIGQLGRGRTLVSGPTFNYQPVIEEQSDVLDATVQNADGSYTYTYPVPIPAAYLPPANDTDSFGPLDGELAGQALLGGTYTVGLYFRWTYTVGTESFRDQGDTVAHFLFGGATSIEPREVVAHANCNQCHVDLEAHGTNRKDVRLCLLCHTAGAEDRNVASAAGGTPGVSVEFSRMIHKIHSGSHLPSVNGVATNPDGSRDYDAEPTPYVLVGFGDSEHDYSDVSFPVWPYLSFPLPRDLGYSSLTADQQDQEDAIRTGPAGCVACHGDPDGSGPLSAPSQGHLIYSQPSRGACGSCHDDVEWTRPYTSNGSTMPAQNDDSACTLCHEPSGDALAVMDGHRHPLLDPSFNPGLHFDLASIEEAGASDGDGTIDPGEKVSVTFSVQDDAGQDVDPGDISSMSTVLSGPTFNYNLVLNSGFPTAALSGPQPYTSMVPELIQLELLGVATAGADTFATERAPHWNVADAETTVLARTAGGSGSDLLRLAANAPANHVDLMDSTGFERNDYVVIDDGVPGQEEYLRIQWVEGDRLWFSSPASSGYPPGLRFDHDVGATVGEVELTELVEGVHYDLDEATGEVDEIAFTDGQEILVSYTSDFVMPSAYPLALNSSPDLGEEHGQWTGKSLADGTYTLGMWGYRSLSLSLFGETNSYRGASVSTAEDFLVGGASDLEAYDKIQTAESCAACHKDLMFHGGTRRGWSSCVLCHGTAGSEDRPRYVAAGAPDTTGVTVNFRTMLHKIHMGADLAEASTYALVGFGPPSAYPNNFSVHHYDEVEFPALPAGVKDCTVCHGDSNEAWSMPEDREHPTEASVPVLEWTVTCGSCHDSDSAQAHIELQTTTGGQESCTVCHGGLDELSVEVVHKPR